MAIKLGWIAARTNDDLAPVLTRIRMQAAKDDVPEGFRIGPRPRSTVSPLRRLFGAKPSTPAWTSAVMLGWEFHAAPLWAQAVSAELRCTTVAFFVFEGTWSYAVFDSGSEVLAMESYALPRATVYGDRDRAAALLGVERDLFDRYEAALRRANDDEEVAPLPGDEHSPDDEWAHLDFARRFGVAYPDPGEGTELRFAADVAPITSAKWTGLAPRLPMPLDPARSGGGNEIDFDHFPSGDDPF